MMAKRLTFVVWAGLLAAGLAAGCGGSGEPSGDDAESADSGSETEGTQPLDTGTGQGDSESAALDTESQTLVGSDSGSGSETQPDTVDTESGTESTDETDTSVSTDETDTEGSTDSQSQTEDSSDTESESETVALGPALLSVSPGAAPRTEDVILTLSGERFTEGMEVELTEPASGLVEALGAAVVSDTGTSATVTLLADLERPQGLYDVTVIDLDGLSDILEGALFVSALPPPQVTDVEPDLAWIGVGDDEILSDRRISIRGRGFVNTPWVEWVSADDASVRFDAAEVGFIDDGTLEAVVPSESAQMPVGAYHVFVINPDNLTGQWLDAGSGEPKVFTITDTPPPRIDSIDPVQWPANQALDTLTIRGAYFQQGAAVEFLTDGEPISVEGAAFVSAQELTMSISADLLVIGFYPIRVTNPDGQSDVFYVYEAKNGTDGHFGEETFTEVEAIILAAARERLAAVVGFDPFGKAHIFAVGGLDDAGDVRDDVESAAVGITGRLGGFSIGHQWISEEEPRGPNLMTAPRQGHRVVRVGSALYALGGSAQSTKGVTDGSVAALETVERADILGLSTRPAATPPVWLDEGDLPEGTWYYRISATGAWGESLASSEVQILNEGGTLEVCWQAVDGAEGYNIYRSRAADGRPGTVRYLGHAAGGALCYEDAGANHPAPGFLSATLRTAAAGAVAAGLYSYRVSAVIADAESVAGYPVTLEVAEEGVEIALRWDEIEGATYRVYRRVGDEEVWALAADALDAAEWVDDGTAVADADSAALEGVSPLPPGSLSRWAELPATLVTAREGHGAAVVGNLGPDGAKKTYIYIVGGRSDAGTDSALKSVERAEVLENGDLVIGELTGIELATARSFLTLLGSQGSDITPRPEGQDVDLEPVEKPLYLFAAAGDDIVEAPQNSGLATIEAAQIDRQTGDLGAFVLQSAKLPQGRRTLGAGGAIIDDYLYILAGVATEAADAEPAPLDSNSSRFTVDVESEAAQEVLGGFMASNGAFSVPRSYYAVVRINAHLYLLGGNDGSGPTSSVEMIAQ